MKLHPLESNTTSCFQMKTRAPIVCSQCEAEVTYLELSDGIFHDFCTFGLINFCISQKLWEKNENHMIFNETTSYIWRLFKTFLLLLLNTWQNTPVLSFIVRTFSVMGSIIMLIFHNHS